MENKQVIYVTKYALTAGIRGCEPIREPEEDRYAVVKWPGGVGGQHSFHKGEFHTTREAALARAEEMRKAKIASHERSIAKLRKLSFS